MAAEVEAARSQTPGHLSSPGAHLGGRRQSRGAEHSHSSDVSAWNDLASGKAVDPNALDALVLASANVRILEEQLAATHCMFPTLALLSWGGIPCAPLPPVTAWLVVAAASRQRNLEIHALNRLVSEALAREVRPTAVGRACFLAASC